MLPVIPEPRKELSKYAPKMLSTKINPEKIGDVIGKQGKVIQKIQAECDCKIDISDDGQVFISCLDTEKGQNALFIVNVIANGPEVGAIYRGVVTRLMSFGAFVEILPGRDGLVHISELADRRVEKVEDVVHVGDEVEVLCLGVDPKGKVKLSMKALLPPKAAPAAEAAPEAPAEG